jgi:hypothetical protein
MKAWYSSKTLWFNVTMTIVMSVPVIATSVKAMEPAEAVLIDSVAGVIAGLGNIFLRVWFTDTPIDTPKAQAKIMAEQHELEYLERGE